MFALKRLMPAASFALLFTLAACGDSLSPADVDPVALQSSMSDAAGTFGEKNSTIGREVDGPRRV